LNIADGIVDSSLKFLQPENYYLHGNNLVNLELTNNTKDDIIFHHKYTYMHLAISKNILGARDKIELKQTILFIFAMKETGVKPTAINRDKIVCFKAILSLVKADSDKIGFS